MSSVVISGLRSPTKTWKWSFGEKKETRMLAFEDDPGGQAHVDNGFQWLLKSVGTLEFMIQDSVTSNTWPFPEAHGNTRSRAGCVWTPALVSRV